MNIFNRILYHVKNFRIKRDTLADREYQGIPMNKKNLLSLTSLNYALQEGDFLFCRPKRNAQGKNIQSNVIQSCTGGYYTHCAIYIGNDEVLHAVNPRVSKMSLHGLLKEYDYLVATRLRSYRGSASLATFVNQHIGKQYNLRGAFFAPFFENKYVVSPNICHIGSPQISWQRKDKKKLFCSQLLMEYMSYNGYLTGVQQQERYFQSEYWTPTGLAKYGYGDFFKLVGFLSNAQQGVDRDYFLTGNMDN